MCCLKKSVTNITGVQAMTENTKHVVAIFDLDGTITKNDSYVAFLIGYLKKNPARVVRSALLPFALFLYLVGQRDNRWLKETFLRTIAGGASRGEIAQCVDIFVSRLIGNNLRPGAIEAIQYHRKRGHVLVLATASMDFYAEKIGSRLGFDQVISTLAAWDSHNRLTGGLCGNNCYGANKLERIKRVLGPELCEWRKIVYSDHHSDLPVMEWADKAVAVNPKRGLNAVALKHNYEIRDWDQKNESIS